jgi:hypothetical protein
MDSETRLVYRLLLAVDVERYSKRKFRRALPGRRQHRVLLAGTIRVRGHPRHREGDELSGVRARGARGTADPAVLDLAARRLARLG